MEGKGVMESMSGIGKEKETWRSEQEWSKEGKGDMESRCEVRYEREDEKQI